MSKTSNILSKVSVNPNFDIVWSFKYLLSSTGVTSQHQGGFVTYVSTSSSTYTVGGSGFFLGYDNDPTTQGITGSVLGIGFDTLGFFAVSGIGGRTSGVDILSAKPNSVTIRGGYSGFDFVYNESISSLNTNMTLLTNTDSYQWLRFRIGNVGQTLYIDHRINDNDSYAKLLELPISLQIDDSAFYSVGISSSYPITGTAFTSSNDTVFRIKNFQIEGSTSTPDTFTPSTINAGITALSAIISLSNTSSAIATEDEHILLT